MAVDLAEHGIRVNAIAPGATLTGLTRPSYAAPEARRATEAAIPLGRLGQPDDLVGAVLFLASDDVALGNRQHGNSGRRLSGDLTRRE
jgi:NAD(P)-dependent dehydrogenase (short-subunit alcohol dehydrogenase family)